MRVACIAYREDGRLCARPASILDPQRGGMVCAEHAPQPARIPGDHVPTAQRVCHLCGAALPHEPAEDARCRLLAARRDETGLNEVFA
jgi:hypothetical protein